jgi:CDP-diacylglycerol--glycerol-3-phosphate 3-phosphatidyltransferase
VSNQSFVSASFRDRIRGMAVPVALGLGRAGLTPNALTLIGFGGTCLAAVAAAQRAFLAGGLLVLAFGVFDLFDGALARATGTTSRFGAFLDSTLDRTGESLVYLGIIVGCAGGGTFWLGAVLAAAALTFAPLVTYARAKAEVIGLHGEVGIAPRAERLLLLAGGMVVADLLGGIETTLGLRPGDWIKLPGDILLVVGNGQPWLALALAIIALTSANTVIQRIVHDRRQLNEGAH